MLHQTYSKVLLLLSAHIADYLHSCKYGKYFIAFQIWTRLCNLGVKNLNIKVKIWAFT